MIKIHKVYIENCSNGQDCILVKAVAELVNQEDVRVGNITSTGQNWNVKHESGSKYYIQIDQMDELTNLVAALRDIDTEPIQQWYKDNLN